LAPPIETPATESPERRRPQPFYHVVLLNDDEHTEEYVIRMLCDLFVLSEERARNRAAQLAAEGRTVVITCERAEAEFGRAQIEAYGADPRVPHSSGSMRAAIEPVQFRPG
jgi:ATP-dependent Clp protease adaptor protein ClpS